MMISFSGCALASALRPVSAHSGRKEVIVGSNSIGVQVDAVLSADTAAP